MSSNVTFLELPAEVPFGLNDPLFGVGASFFNFPANAEGNTFASTDTFAQTQTSFPSVQPPIEASHLALESMEVGLDLIRIGEIG